MAVVRIDASEQEDQIIVSGDIAVLLGNKRAMRLVKDYSSFSVHDDCIWIDVKDDLIKSISRIQMAAKHAKCEIAMEAGAQSGVQAYYEEDLKFKEFSLKALNIRNNQCNVAEFSSFKDSLIENMKSRTLYPLQMLAAYHLAFSQNACNFSVPGAGKTSIVYGAYAYLKNLPPESNRKVDRIVIISPLNAFAPWEMEYQECFGQKPSSKRLSGTMDVEGKKQYLYSMNPAEITLLSYASVLSLSDELIYFLKRNKVMLVLDEAHKIKNATGGVISEKIMALAPYCKSRVVLTGTPAQNGYEDLYNLFKFIWPSKEIIRFHVGQLKDMTRTKDDYRVPSLLDAISPYFIRIRKSDLGIPPAVNHPPIQVRMKPAQRKIYDYIESQYINDIATGYDKQFRSELVKARLIRLMQAATNPALLSQPLSDFRELEGIDLPTIEKDTAFIREILSYSKTEIPAKYETAKDLIQKIIAAGGKVIVWACFIKSIDMFQDYLQSQGIASRTLYGRTPIAGDTMTEEDEEYSRTREAIVKEFHDPNCPYKVIIANPFAVAESISLHKACHNAIYLERSFNAAHFLQSKDRIHRYGLEDGIVTNYYYLVSDDSIDTTINDRLVIKEKRLLDIIENSPIPLFDNYSDEGGDEDIKAVLRDYVRRTKAI